jgi:hypothetical protein
MKIRENNAKYTGKSPTWLKLVLSDIARQRHWPALSSKINTILLNLEPLSPN